MTWYAEPPLPRGPSFEEMLATGGFPLYGILEKPQGLTVQGVGTTCQRFPGQERLLLQAIIHFAGYGPGDESLDRQRRPKLHLCTTNPQQVSAFGLRSDRLQLPKDGQLFDVDGRPYTCYASVEALEEDAAPVASCILIERFSLAEEVVRAEFRHWTRPDDEWLFTLRCPGMYIDGHAWSWSRIGLLKLIRQVGVLNNQPGVVDQYRREMATWAEYFHRRR